VKFQRQALTSAREQAGLSKPKLAQKAGVGVATVYDLENPKSNIEPRPGSVEKIAKALGVDWTVFYAPTFQETASDTPAAS